MNITNKSLSTVLISKLSPNVCQMYEHQLESIKGFLLAETPNLFGKRIPKLILDINSLLVKTVHQRGIYNNTGGFSGGEVIRTWARLWSWRIGFLAPSLVCWFCRAFTLPETSSKNSTKAP